MFGFVSRFFSHFWEGISTEENKNLENELGNEAFLTKTQTNDDIKSHGAKFETQKLRKVFHGKVTKLYDDSGLVDHEVFFTFDKVIGGIRPKLNGEVHIEASRRTVHDGWKAERVEVLSTDWNDFDEEGAQEVLIGDITDINENYLIVNYDVHCPMSSLAVGYVPFKGDWVRAEVIKYRGIVCDVQIVEPLREKSLTGIVTSVGCGHGYIDTEIFFSFGACKKNYIPRKGHTVTVTAIESDQGNSKWRAVKIEPKVPRRDTNYVNMTRPAPIIESKFMKKLLENKANIVINNNINFGGVMLGQCQEAVVSIRNDGLKSVVLKSVDGLLADSIFEIHLIGQEATKNIKDLVKDTRRQLFDVQINPQSSIEVKVTVNSRFLGEFNQLVVFNFGEFQIGRYFTVNVQDKQQQILGVRTPYHKRKFVDKKEALNRVLETSNNQQWVIPGERPMFKQKIINISTKLRQYEIPRTLRQYILDKMDLCCLVPSLGEPLSMRNYKERFSALLHAEEVQMELEMREFDLEQVSLKPVGDFLSLAVPGLAEGRPSLLIGDRVILCVSGGSYNSPKYEGFIHEVLSTEVLLKFNEDFHITYDMDSYDVMFFFNRTPLRRCHKAVEAVNCLGDQVLFPSEVQPKLPQAVGRSKKDKGLFNSNLNERQRAAVSRILIGQSRPMPYVLFGPPGTGKTVTLVEAILQIFHRISSSRILACTPSNSAADLIAERLHHSGGISEGDMVRLNAFQRQQNISEDIENYSTNVEKLDVAAYYRIVICTCSTAGQLHTLGLAPGHFTHVIIDEAGQATEPESLVPISFLAGTEGQVILAGDPFQLGAVLRSPIAKTYGLDVSLLERLMSRTPYLRDETKFSDHGSYDPLAVTKLIYNYRSHEALLELPSRLLYHAEMVPCAEKSVKDCLCGWDTLPNKNDFPVLFHGVKGEDLREGNSPSWFNAVEAVQVIRYVQELRKFEKHPVKLDDIGIITPYRKQVEKVRLLLDRLGMSEIKVGSVEEFQGQERLVIVISTVRSRENFIGFDYTHNIGFLSNPKRFNVAITRAQALMIVIGNPHVLVKDTNWRALLRYCVDNKAYIGCDLPPLNDIFGDECEHDNWSSALNDLQTRENIVLRNSPDEGVSSSFGLDNGAFQISSGEKGHCSDKLLTVNCSVGTSQSVHRSVNQSDELSSSRPSASRELIESTVDMEDIMGEKEVDQLNMDRLGSSRGVTAQSITDKGEQRIDEYPKDHLGSTCIQRGADRCAKDHLIRGDIKDKFGSNRYGDHITNGVSSDKVEASSNDGSQGVTPDISMNKLGNKSTEGSKRDIGGASMVKMSVKGLHGARQDTSPMDMLGTSISKHDSSGVSMDKIDSNGTSGPFKGGTKGDICGIAVDNLGIKNGDVLKSRFSKDNLDTKSQPRASRQNEGVYGYSMDQSSAKHDYATRNSESKTNQSKINKSHIKDKTMSDQTVNSSKLLSAIKLSSQGDGGKINCFDNENETPTLPAAGCEDKFDESSDDDIEEIVYKGEMP